LVERQTHTKTVASKAKLNLARACTK